MSRRKNYTIKSLLVISISLASAGNVLSQAPDIAARIKTNNNGIGVSPYTTHTDVTGSWSGSFTDHINSPGYAGADGEVNFAGSISSSSLTITTSAEWSGETAPTGSSYSADIIGGQNYQLWVQGHPTVLIEASNTGSVVHDSSGVDNRAGVTGPYPIYHTTTFSNSTGTNNTVSNTYNYSASQSLLVNLNCNDTGSELFPSTYPGVYYNQVLNNGSYDGFVAKATVGRGLSGSVFATGTTVLSVTFGDDDPIAEFKPVTVNNVVGATPHNGDTIRVESDSYDPDNQSESALAGICTHAWKVTRPDGSFSTGSSTYLEFTATFPGDYLVELTVTDNEGVQVENSTTVHVNPRTPGGNNPDSRDEDEQPVYNQDCGGAASGMGGYGGGQSAAVKVYPNSGLVDTVIFDPVRTRGYPLRNHIHLNTQSQLPERTTSLGNGVFTYGIAIALGDVYNDEGELEAHWFLVDGNGNEIDFGIATSAPVAPAGVYSILTQGTGSFTLSEAGPPDKIHKAGNFTYEFDGGGRLTSITDPKGNVQTLTYDEYTNLIAVEDESTGKTLEFTYSGSRISVISEADGESETHITYTDGKITTIEIKDSTTAVIREFELTYDTEGRIETFTRDSDSSSTITYSYVSGGNGVSLGNISTTQGGSNFNYVTAPPTGGQYRVTRTNSNSGAVHFDFDEYGNFIKLTQPTHYGATGNAVYTFGYDGNFNMTSSQGTGTTYTITRTAKGLPAQITDSAGNYVLYTYDGVNITEIEDNIGTLYEFSYEDTNQPNVVTKIENAIGGIWERELNSFGQITEVTPPTGSKLGSTTYVYDENSSSPTFGYLKEIMNGEGEVTTFDYDSFGNLSGITTSPDGTTEVTTTILYDAAQRPILVTNDDATTQEYLYTGRDLSESTDEEGTTVEYEWCKACGALSKLIEPLSREHEWAYDADFDVTTFTDARNYDTTYVYGSAKELQSITFPDGHDLTYRYNNNGTLKRFDYDSATKRIELSYNSAGRLSSWDPYDAAATDFTYNADGTLNTVTAPNVDFTFSYTDDRRVESISHDYSDLYITAAQVVEYTYYPDGLVESLTWKNGTITVATWTYDYDAAGRLIEIEDSFGDITTFSYDEQGKLLTQTNENGTEVNYTYNDSRGWPTDIVHEAASTPFASFALEYDGGTDTVGNLTEVTEIDSGVVSYEYDALYRLTLEAKTGTGSYSKSYGHDVSGNVTTVNSSSFATYDSSNKLSTLSGGSVTHDFFGQVKTASGTGLPTSTYTWNVSQRLASQKLGSGSVRNYWYDAFGRLVRTKDSGLATVYIFDGQRVIGEYSDGAPSAVYTWGADGVVARRVLSGGARRWYHYGPQGETRYLTDSSGSVTDTYRYTAYGVPLSTSGSSLNPFRYGGKFGYFYDGFTGILRAGERWYAPHLMRWISRDPILFDGGYNVYEYVSGRVTGYVDPDGTESLSLRDVSNFAAGFGDDLSFGATGWIRDQWNEHIWGFDPVDYDSTAYKGGEVTETVLTCVGGGALIKKGLKNKWVREKAFRYDGWGRWIERGAWKDGYHFHLDPTFSKRLMSHHLPQQRKQWLNHLKAILKGH
ncbi:MAG: RHS repeat-associated core domain-containing protein [Bdellovibrionota bacterium]|nr:MAG: RHS repeat-associated core domain-containing protein [Bdellovibrionota bacterium]